MVDNELLLAISGLLDAKLDAKLEPIQNDIRNIKLDIKNDIKPAKAVSRKLCSCCYTL